MAFKLFQVDAFTDRPFAGNPAAVCLLNEPREDAWLQLMAREMNLSETAFLVKREDNSFDLRWFTPNVEVALCGHATLASAHILWQEELLSPSQTAQFHTLSGLLTATHKGDAIELNFPATYATETTPPERFYEAMGVTPEFLGKSKFDYLLEVSSEEIVRELKPDFVLLKTLPVRGIIVTSRATTAPYDFVSRFFAPAVGIDEDPVTGSAHCALTPYWSKKLGKTEMTAYQASARGGVLKVRLAEDRVYLSGQAVTIFRAEMINY